MIMKSWRDFQYDPILKLFCNYFAKFLVDVENIELQDENSERGTVSMDFWKYDF